MVLTIGSRVEVKVGRGGVLRCQLGQESPFSGLAVWTACFGDAPKIEVKAGKRFPAGCRSKRCVAIT